MPRVWRVDVPMSSELIPRAQAEELLSAGNVDGWRDLRANGRMSESLAGIDLSGVTLNRVDLESLDLSKANLSNAILEYAHLSNANLEGANLEGCSLHKAKLLGAHLSGAILSGANISKARLEKAQMDGAVLTRGSFDGAELNEAIMTKCVAHHATFRGSKLIRTNLQNADLAHAEFVNADLSEANLARSSLLKAEFIGANLSRARLNGCNADGSNFDRSESKGCIFSDSSLKESTFREAKLIEIDAKNADFSEANFNSADLTRSALNQSDFIGADLSLAVLNQANMDGASLCKINASKSMFKETKLRKTDMRGMAVNSGTRFDGAEVNDCQIDRFSLESLNDYGGLTRGDRMSMKIIDDVATLRLSYSGFFQWVHLAALAVFIAPYLAFVSRLWLSARFMRSTQNGIPLWLALARYVFNGGVNWQTGFFPSWSFAFFLFTFVYNIVRGVLLWKTKALEIQESANGLPVNFSLTGRWGIVYRIAWWGFWIQIVVVVLNTLHFFQQIVPV